MYYEVTGINEVEFVKAAYALSEPVGMGYLHFEPGELPDSAAQQIVEHNEGREVLYLDYVKGRCCKAELIRANGRSFIHKKWPDHEEWQLKELLTRIGKPTAPEVTDEELNAVVEEARWAKVEARQVKQ